jgi:SOS response regulatory protein OraA/RecX
MVCKCYGPRRVKQELYKRGIRGSIADEAVEKELDGLYERMESVIERKYLCYLEDPNDLKSIAKVKNALARLGYDFDDINSVVNEYLEEE